MSQGGYVTLVGFVAREPMLRNTKDGTSVADVRIGTTARYLDRENGVWRDGETCYYTVNCWRRLADNVRASLHKGDPVVVKGKFRTRTYKDKEGLVKTEAEIVADTIGHDLSRGIANFIRPPRYRPEAADELAAGELARSGGLPDFDSDGPDDTGEESMPSNVGAPPFADPGSGAERINEEAVENFAYGLGDDQAMARELGEPEETAEPALPF
jgi:single-strand DNA-binding protein